MIGIRRYTAKMDSKALELERFIVNSILFRIVDCDRVLSNKEKQEIKDEFYQDFKFNAK